MRQNPWTPENAGTSENRENWAKNGCAQPGDNLVDQRWVSVGGAALAGDGLWGAAQILPLVPSEPTDRRPSSTVGQAQHVPTDLRKEQFSTVSTTPMTTSLRQGLRMTQALRAAGASKMGSARTIGMASTAGMMTRVGAA